MGKLKRRFLSFVLLSFIASLCITISSCSQKPEEKKEDVIKIGAILPLTGEVSLFGGWLKDGIEFAIDTEKELRVNMVYEDSMSKVSKALSAYQKLTKIDNVDAIITAQTPIANVIAPLTASDKVFTVFTFADLPEGEKKYLVNYHFPVTDEAFVLAKFAYNNVGHSGAIVTVGDEFGRLGSKVFIEQFNKLNGKIVSRQQLAFSGENVRPLLLKMKEKRPDFIFIIAYSQQLLAFTKAMKEMNIQIPLIGPNVITVYLNLIQNYLPQFSYFTMSSYDIGKTTGEAYKNFVTNYTNQKGTKPTMVTAEAYEATKILLKAIKEKGIKNIPEYYDNLVYYGIFGKVVIDSNRQAHFPLAVVKVENGNKKEVMYEFIP